MSWTCPNCSSNNDDENRACFVCGEAKPEVSPPPVVERPTRKASTRSTASTSRSYKWRSFKSLMRSYGAKSITYSIISSLLVVAAFVIGRWLLFDIFERSQWIFTINGYLQYTGFYATDWNLITIMTGLSFGACVTTILFNLYFINRGNYLYVWLWTPPVCLAAIAIPGHFSIVIFLLYLLMGSLKKSKWLKLAVPLSSLLMISWVLCILAL